ncbi:MAG TPA: aldo/keto reductase [Verrucomicrobia bacterium]|nr:MAG: alcohol dehydrogenase [Lentisphaerae bacterium GWF2_57_35]HBA85567.1 aldo/keto reductase [Verrucomicrobiota bacterium]
MQYRHMGKWGLKLSELSFGSWITFGRNLDIQAVRMCMRTAFDHGVNFFDNAEAYGRGVSEMLMGEALREFPRDQVAISTKIFWGGDGVNDTGLNAKHLIEGTKRSLRRLGLEYVDLLFCHRPDPETPIEETVRAMDVLLRQGLAIYWGTSEWSAEEIETAHRWCREMNVAPPCVEQPEYNLFVRDRVEKEYVPLYEKYGMGATIWSPLAGGILTGKYNNGIPPGSRLEHQEWLRQTLTPERIQVVKELMQTAGELGCSVGQLALAWCLKNPRVSTVIMGAAQLAQLEENLQAVEVKKQLTDEVMKRIRQILDRREG